MRLLVFLAVPVLATAQFSGFATTGDGGVLYFSSPLTTDRTWPQGQSRIYRVAASGVSLAFERTEVPPAPPNPPVQRYSNYFNLVAPEVSRDGSVLAFTGIRICLYSSFCASATTTEVTVAVGGEERKFVGSGRLSGNGRYLLTYGNGSIGGGPVSVKDLQAPEAGTETPSESFQTLDLGPSRVVADDGTAVFSAYGTLYMLRGGVLTRFVQTPTGEPVIDAAGRSIVYTYGSQYISGRSLHVYRLAERTASALSTGCADAHSPSLSSDGRRVMFLCSDRGASVASAIRTVNTDGTGLRQVVVERSGIVRAVMSDDGRRAWYHSGGGRVLQLDLESGNAEERIGRTPEVVAPALFIAGSAATITGFGLSDTYESAQSFPLPRTLGGVTVRVGGVEAPLLSVTPTAATFQVPWELSTSGGVNASVPFEIVTGPTTSLFLRDTRYDSRALRPARGSFVQDPQSQSSYGGFNVAAIHEGWDALVTSSNPAVRGEIVHVYGTGFGRVKDPPRAGMPAPLSPPLSTIEPVTCWTWSADSVRMIPIEVLFAGLAPGLAGYYQLDMRIPVDNVRSSMQFYCNGEGNPERPYSGDFLGSLRVKLP